MGRRRIGELLIEDRLISGEQLHYALSLQKENGERIGKIMVDLGFLNEEVLLEYLLKQLLSSVREDEVMYQTSGNYNVVEVYRRLERARGYLTQAWNLLATGSTSQSSTYIYFMIYHTAVALFYLTGKLYLGEADVIGLRSVITGFSGDGSIRLSLLFRNNPEEAFDLTEKTVLRGLLKSAEGFLGRVEKLATYMC